MRKTLKKSTIIRKLEYKKQSFLKNFRVSKQDVNNNQDSIAEIEFKHGPSRGLTIVRDPVYDFFVQLNSFCCTEELDARTFSFIS